MTPALLAETAQALYGPHWQSALARDLNVADRTVRRWVAGTTPVPSGVAVDLRRIATERVRQLDGLVERLKRAGA